MMKKTEVILQKLSGRIMDMPKGTKLPSLRQLQKEYKVSMTTLNKVMGLLHKQQKVDIIHGSGIYTAVSPENSKKELASVDILYFGNTEPIKRPGYVSDLIHYLSIGLGRDSVGTTVSIFSTECSLEDALPVLKELKKKAVLTLFLQNVEFISYFQRLKIPHIAITPDVMRYHPNCIYIDNQKLMQTIFQQLIACGHRKIAYLHNYNPLFFSRDLYEREKYFYQECVNNKLIIESELIQYAGFTSKEYCCAIKKIIQSGFSFSAIIASDTYAVNIYEELEKYQLKSGRDVAVVGIDDLESNEYLRPRLSSIRISREMIANTAYDMLKYMLKNDIYSLDSRYITPEWIERDSVPDLNTPEK